MKILKKFILMFIAITGVLIASCSGDNTIGGIDPSDDNGPIPAKDLELNGSIEKDRVLDSGEIYSLTGILSIESGATLTIPAGTEIIADTDTDRSDATNVYIVVQKGAKIEIKGTSSSPIIMRSASGKPGTWGGLIIAGNAPTAAGSNAIAEVGNIIYGGEDVSDDSGSINYLILSDAGAIIDGDSQFNGLSLYALGGETSIQNIAIMNGADDGVEFFGGTVSISNIYLENNEDDAVDWSEGWSGKITNTYVFHTIENFSTAIEADGENNNPQVENFTAVSTTGGTALQFRANSGAVITGLSLSGYETIIDITDDNLTSITVDGEIVDLDNAYDAEATVDIAMFDWAN